jgi:ribosomal peptide maturation radical SAM protein 1
MPWSSIDNPSLALGILKGSITKNVADASAQIIHGNLDYVDWITSRCDFNFEDYQHYALDTYFLGVGDWVFSSALYEDPEWRVDEFNQHVAGQMSERMIAKGHLLHKLAPAFISDLAQRVAALEPDVVGFTTTFQQNTAALATARDIKRINPSILTIFGGANCDGDQGAALHRNFPFVDFVVRGEGEAAFPQTLTALQGQGSYASVPGLCWRAADGRAIANTMTSRPLPPSEIGAPDFDDYFDRVVVSAAGGWVEPRLVVEGARGCWWGQKHHCKFCGLNGSLMQFRSKPADVFVTELLDLVARHNVLDITVVDNILEMDYVTTVLPRLAASGYDLRILYEIKSNMRFDQLKGLLAAGVEHVQPGIESLSGNVLKLMDKGVTGCQNVRLLRDAESLGIWSSWNYLCGFPGEQEEDYTSIIEQFPALYHLTPPGSATRIAIERFSPYYERPDLGFADVRPDPQYGVTYDLPARELRDLAYLFAASPLGVDEGVVDRLREASRDWKSHYLGGSRLTYLDLGDEIMLVNSRPHFSWHAMIVREPAEMDIFRLLDQPHSVNYLVRKLARPAVTQPVVSDLLSRWQELGLVFTDGGQFIQVASIATNQELLRVDAGKRSQSKTGDIAEPAAACSGQPTH